MLIDARVEGRRRNVFGLFFFGNIGYSASRVSERYHSKLALEMALDMHRMRAMKSRYLFQCSWTFHLDKAPAYRTLLRSVLLHYFEPLRREGGFQVYRYSGSEKTHCIWGKAPDKETFNRALKIINMGLSRWVNSKGRFSTPLSSRSHFIFDQAPIEKNVAYHSRRCLVGTPTWIRFQRRERYLEILRRKIPLCPASV